MKLNVEMSLKQWFFDRQKVIQRMDRASVRALSKAGAFIRKRARSLLRRRKRTSNPGETPSVHSEDKVANLKNILFGLDPISMSVVIGPVGLNMRTQDWITLGTTTVPQLMEFGGVAQIREWSWNGGRTWSRQDLRFRHTSRKRKDVYNFISRRRRAIYRPRPFMGPALEAEVAAGTIPAGFIGALSRAA